MPFIVKNDVKHRQSYYSRSAGQFSIFALLFRYSVTSRSLNRISQCKVYYDAWSVGVRGKRRYTTNNKQKHVFWCLLIISFKYYYNILDLKKLVHSYRKTSTDFRWFSASIWVFNTLSAWCEDGSCAYLRLFEKRLHEVSTAARWRSGRPASARTRLQLQAHGRLLRDRSVIPGVMLWRARLAVYGPDRRRISDDKGSISRRH